MKKHLRLSGGRKIRSPVGQGTRPTTAKVREAVMNLLSQKLQGSSWLELCSGSGVMSCEALQRGVHKVVAVERDRKTAKICNENITTTSTDLVPKRDVMVINQEVVSWLQRKRKNANKNIERFNLVYFDPPYDSNLYSPVIKALLEGDWLDKDAIVICEHAAQQRLMPPPYWIEKDRRLYGTSALLLITPLKNCCDDTDSKHQRTSQG